MRIPPEKRRTLGIIELLFGRPNAHVAKPEPPHAYPRLEPAPAPRAVKRVPKVRLLYLLPIPLLVAALMGLAQGRLDVVLVDGSVFALFMLAANLTQRGLRAAHAQQTLRFARLERFPLKTLGGLLTGLATALAAALALGQGVGLALAYAVVALLGFHFVYGFEALGRTRAIASDDERARKVAQALAEAEHKLIALERLANAIANQELRVRLHRIGVQGRRILDQIAARPTDLSRARKFLTVYLDGVEQVTDGYARTHQLADSLELEQNFRNVLVTVERVFDEQHQRLLKSDVLDLDVQIEVLKKQLEREGLG